MHEYAQALHDAMKEGAPFVTITLVAIRGSAPQIVGAKAIVDADGLRAGTVGGGGIEAIAIRHAFSLLQPQSPTCELKTWNLQTEIGMSCGGEVQFLFERHCAVDWHIAIFGAGHIVQALVPLLMTLECQVTVMDTRSDWLDRLSPHPKLRTRPSQDLAGEVASFAPGTFFLSITKGHATDRPIVATVLEADDVAFVGCIGSKNKAAILRRELGDLGLPEAAVARLQCPLGLPLGNNTPAEIAISIAAQLLHVRDTWQANVESGSRRV